MKKNLLFAAAALVAFAACTKESPVKEEGAIDASKLVFNIDVRNADATKGVKTAWENGDDVYVFFEDNTAKYVKMTYDGSAWTYNVLGDGDLSLAASGKKLSAVYMPDFVCSDAPTYDSVNSRWTFGSIAGYYQKTVDEGVSYTVTSTANVNTLNAVINLTAPSNIMQFYVPADQCAAPGAGNEYVLTATHVINYTFNGIVPGGAASQGNQLNGGAMQGYSGTLDTETGYYFWGILESAGSYKFDCQLVKQNAEKKYAISSYFVSKDLTAHSFSSAAIKLTGLTDKGNFVDLGFGNILWATGNLTETSPYIADPLAAGEYYKWGYTTPYDKTGATDAYVNYKADGYFEDTATAKDTKWSMPTLNQFDVLCNSANTNATTYSQSWKTGWTYLGSTKGGMLITSKKNGLSLFLAAAGIYISGSLGSEGDVGIFWSSTSDSSGDRAFYLGFDDGGIYTVEPLTSRDCGFPVRPVQNIVTP